MSKLPSEILLAIGFLFCVSGGLETNAVAFDCQRVLTVLTTPRELRAELVRSRETDSRWGLRRLVTVSPTLDRLDNFSSPATLRTLIFDWKKEKAGVPLLSGNARSATSLVRAVSAQSHVPPHVEFLFELVESRHRVALEVIGLALVQKGQPPEIGDLEFSRSLIETMQKIVAELKADSKYSTVFGDFAFDAVDWSRVTKSIAADRAQVPRFVIAREGRTPIREEFLSAVDPGVSPIDQVDSLGRFLAGKLEELPVGIVHVMRTMTSAVRFGPRLYFANWAGYQSTMRNRYLRSNVGRSITSEVTLRVSSRRKKLLALYLDRTHRELDPLFGLDRRRGRWLHTCGSYVPATFWKCGVPIVTPAFFTPGAAVASLRVQKALGLPNVIEATYRGHRKPNGLVLDGAIIAGHEVWLTIWEVNLMLDLGTGLGYLVNHLL